MKKTLLSTGVIATAVTMAVASVMAPSDAHAVKKGKEKCYGVVKAGQNGCGDSEGKHSCEGQAPEDGLSTEWIALPKGVCDKIVGGSTEPHSNDHH